MGVCVYVCILCICILCILCICILCMCLLCICLLCICILCICICILLCVCILCICIICIYIYIYIYYIYYIYYIIYIYIYRTPTNSQVASSLLSWHGSFWGSWGEQPLNWGYFRMPTSYASHNAGTIHPSRCGTRPQAHLAHSSVRCRSSCPERFQFHHPAVKKINHCVTFCAPASAKNEQLGW